MRRATAFILTLATPGIGHLALGRRRRAGHWIVAFQTLIVAWAVLVITMPIGSLLSVVVILVLWLAALIDVLVVARSTIVPRWFVVGGAAVVFLGLINLEGAAIRHFVTRAYTVPASSMRPTLEAGDYFLADKTAYRRGDPRRGDIIVFAYPPDPRRTFVKRVVALPGERVLLRGRQVFVNGSPIVEPYLPPATMPSPVCAYAYGCLEILVPADSYFVLGDNRENSQDSRFWGFIPRRTIFGRAAVIYWSIDPTDRTLRTRRIGTSLERV